MKNAINKNKAQVGIEYMIVVGFVTFAIISIIALAFFYSSEVNDQIRLNQVESFAIQLINSAESVFFAGEPSKTTMKLYLPDGVESIELNGYYVVITTRVSGNINKRAYESRVPFIAGTISPSEGLKKLSVEARTSDVLVTLVS